MGEGLPQLLDVINEAERENIPRSKAEEVIEKLNQIRSFDEGQMDMIPFKLFES